jgi:serine/threonine protein kinase
MKDHHTQSRFPAGTLLANKRYRILREINRGGAAIVYEAEDTLQAGAAGGGGDPAQQPSNVALKCHDLRSADPRSLDRLKREIMNAKDVIHQNVVRLYNVILEGDCLVLILELVKGCDLLEVINKAGGKLPENLSRHYFVQLMSGVTKLHESNLCHRDLKPENCMVDEGSNTLKVIDLGLSKHLTSAQTLGVGTPDYMAPELINFTHDGSGCKEAYNASAADVWSMGATLYLMVVGAYPFENPDNPRDITSTLRNVLSGNYRPFPDLLKDSLCADLLRKMLIPQPSQRITLESIWEHPWVKNNN